MKKKVIRKAQVTIFIIIGVSIVLLLLLAFFFMSYSHKFEPFSKKQRGLYPYIEECIQESVEKAIRIVSRQGGDINPKGFKEFNDSKVVYLCYNEQYFQRCVNQRPLLIEHVQDEITSYISPHLQDCFERKLEEFQSEYEITQGKLYISTELHPGKVIVDVNKKVKMKRGDETHEFNNFKLEIPHPLYNLLEIAMEVVNQEAKYCNFDEVGYMVFYPQYDIKKFETGDGDMIYRIKDRKTGQSFQFAIRSCRMPPGY